MADGAMESLVVTMLNIEETLIPCTWMLRFVHAQDVYNHLIDDLCLVVFLGVESSGFSELGFQQLPETRPKCVEEPVVSVGDDGLSYPKMDPHFFKEELGSVFRFEILLVGCEDGHLQKPINDHKSRVIALLGGRKARHVIH
jgi:hypothetical protein